MPLQRATCAVVKNWHGCRVAGWPGQQRDTLAGVGVALRRPTGYFVVTRERKVSGRMARSNTQVLWAA
jgi:hypothetical protein